MPTPPRGPKNAQTPNAAKKAAEAKAERDAAARAAADASARAAAQVDGSPVDPIADDGDASPGTAAVGDTSGIGMADGDPLPNVVAAPKDPSVAARRADRAEAVAQAKPAAELGRFDIDALTSALNDDEKAALLAALGGVPATPSFKLEPAEVGSALWVRQRDILLSQLMDGDHARDCPGSRPTDPGADIRIEAYPDTVPPDGRRGTPARPVTVVACLHCGARRAIEDTHTNVTERVIAQLAGA